MKNKKKIYLYIITTIFLYTGCGSSDTTIEKEVVPHVVVHDSIGDIEINEVMAANTHTVLDQDYYAFSDWIELHNISNHAVNISGYGLGDKPDTIGWKIPDGITMQPDEYLVIWADKQDVYKKALHTNFKLSMNKDVISLFDNNGKKLHAFALKNQLPDISVTSQDGKLFYMTPTPNTQNREMYPANLRTKDVSFSTDEGIYDTVQPLSLDAEGSIYYTTDGSVPTVNSTKYTNPLTIDKTISIRAISFEKGKLASQVQTKSYLINEPTIDMPVIFLSIDKKYLYDDMIGIYTIGKNGKSAEGCDDERGIKLANYMQKWERPAHMTMFEENKKSVLSQDIGIKISGECSRMFVQKSFQLKSDNKYGRDDFEYQVFPDKPIKKYKRLKLRNAGQDIAKTHFRDALSHMIIAKEMHLNYEAYRPAIVFINGKYWGLYSLREKLTKSYLKENYGVKKVNLLEGDRIIKEGDSNSYDQLISFIKNNDLSSQENYNHVTAQIDIDNYIDYMITNIYIANADWPGTNIFYWQERKNNSKWQWLLHDTDFGFGLYGEGVNYNTLEAVTTISDKDWPNPEWSTFLFRSLLENQAFKTKFKNRFRDKLNTTFQPKRITSFIDKLSSKIAPQMERYIKRWDILHSNVNDKADWEYEVQELRNFADKRVEILKGHLNNL